MQYVNNLEPKYSAIDLTEVELPETDNNHNANSEYERDDENTNTLHDVSSCLIKITVVQKLPRAYYSIIPVIFE